jgi:FKBP-type peptidyl-prolyl cis-trans isomerase
MKKFFTLAVAVLAAVSMTSCNGQALKTDLDSLSYFMGTNFGASVENFINTVEGEVDLDLFVAGMKDHMAGKIEAEPQEIDAFIRNYMNVVNPQKALEASNEFLANMEKKSGVEKTESGLVYKVVREGDAEKKAIHDTDKVRVCYEGKLRNGVVFDSSYERGDTVSFALNQVIKGWSEGVKLVGEGGEIILYIPSNLAYGRWGQQRGGIGPNQCLEFRVEVVEVIPTPEEELKRIEEAKKEEAKK